MFPVDASTIDKSLPVPVGTQLYGLLSYYLSHSDIPYGTKLQSVRQLAAELGIAPMTVSQVYQQLRDAGLIEMRRGKGAYSARDPHKKLGDEAAMANLREEIGKVLDKADRLGISPSVLATMITAQAQLRKPRGGLTIMFVGIFEAATRDYVAEIRPVLEPGDQIHLVTLDQLTVSAEAQAAVRRADVVLTFVHREVELRKIVPEANILAIRFIPSTHTRQALAGLPPRARVAAITYFKDYIAIMKPSVREFAPHVSDVTVAWAAAPDLPELLNRCDAVIYATGADDVRRLARPGIPCFEFRHAPDPDALENLLVPYLAQLRRAKIASADAGKNGASEPSEMHRRRNRREPALLSRG
ncbi:MULTISPECIES: GntR family transcriptional regulator [Chelativorans]|jgi:DNA-binding transcriptional regulator YhcF (GntR family)|uniref:Transcriptional regulator, GntR family n=1 Tax=Chelativorans sp. (strain BNC1) TaxID=266779 RepID=Q11DM3_CHESB|nr:MULTISPECIES: GntR family transcriptional regulator [Chelativorans]